MHLLIRGCVTIIAAVLGAEILCGLYYTIDKHEVFWTRAVTAPHEIEAASRAPAQEIPNMLSPYFGVVRHPGFTLEPSWTPDYLREYEGIDYVPDYVHWHANNYGFLQDKDYPVTDLASSDFVVGIFGSSVAMSVSLDGRRDIIAELEKNPGLAGRNIVVLDFASIGGLKPPQQALILTYFIALGQRFDLIINMDGMGNAFFSWENIVKYHVDPMLPDARLVIGLQNLMISKDQVDKAAATREQIAALDRAAARTRSAIRYYWLLISRNRLTAADAKLEEENSVIVPGRFYIELLNEAKAGDYQAELGRIADVWVRNSLEMGTLARSIGAAYLHVLEPNQWFGAKPFSEVERKRFAQPGLAPMSEIIPITYRAFLSASPRLTGSGIDFIDATKAFDHHPETLYIDWCCHFNAAAVHALVTETLGPTLRTLRVASH